MTKILIKNARYLILTAERIIEQGALYIESQRVAKVGHTTDLRDQEAQSDIVLDAGNKIVMPGLIDAHNHIGESHMFPVMGLLREPLRGIGDALERFVWPAYVWTPEEAVYDLELFGFLNLIKHGTTSTSDAFMYPDECGRAAVDSGLRVELAPTLITSIRLPDSNGPEDDLQRTARAIQSWHGAADGRITYRVHPSATYNCHAWFLEACAALAKQYDVGLATHIAESNDEVERALQVWPEGLVRRAQALGLTGPKSLFFHSCVLNDDEVAIYAETGSSSAHCPLTNSRKGVVSPVPRMYERGVNVGLGTDLPNQDMFNVLHLVKEIHPVKAGSHHGLSPHTIFDMATRGGARALNLQGEVGTLEPGMKADVITLDLARNTRLFPLIPEVLIYELVFRASGCDVSDVIVDGELLMQDRKLLHLDEERIIQRAQQWTDRYLADYFAKVDRGEKLVVWQHPEFQA